MEKYATYSLTEGTSRRIDLHKNFRSRHQVLDSTNEIFERIMDTDLGKVAYDDAARLYTGAAFAEEPEEEAFTSEMLLLDLKEEEEEEPEETARELEARMVGNRILELVGKQPVWDKTINDYRPAQFGDMVILLRTISGWAEDFAKILGKMGIPVFAGARNGYFSAPEVQTVLALLKIIDNPCQDIPLTAVLYSPIGGLSAQQLAELKSQSKEKPFYQICQEAEELQGFYEMLNRFRKKAVYTPIQELLWELLDETGYLAYVSAMPAGKQRRANLEMLLEKAASYEAGSYHGLYHFVRYMENLHKYEIDFGEATVGGEESHMVRIMSIHKSKGLEFPIVFVSGMGKNLNQSDAQSAFVTHMDLGIGCDVTDPVLRVSGSTLFKNFIKMQIRNENLGEEMRVLYVALTRAKEKLIVTGAVDDLEKKLEKWEERTFTEEGKLSFTDRVQARTDLDWMMPVLCREMAQSFQQKICHISDLMEQEAQRQTEYLIQEQELLQLPEDTHPDPEAQKQLQQQLAVCYAYEAAAQIPSKVSVSEVKKKSLQEPEESLELYEPGEEEAPSGQSDEIIPKFLQEEAPATGAGRGTIYHKIMEAVDLNAEVQTELQRMVEKGILTEKDLECVDTEKLVRFQKSRLGQRMARAQKKGCLYREQQFVMEVSAAEIHPEWDSSERILMQGIIDAYFIEENQIVLVDYKTDFVKFQEASSLYEKYRVQLGCYKKALESLTDYPVKETLIYSFCLNRELTGSEKNGNLCKKTDA